MAVPKKGKRAKGKHGGARPGTGPKPIVLADADVDHLQELCKAGAPHVEIAHFLRISPRTLERMLEDEATLYTVKNPRDRRQSERLSLPAIVERGYAHMRIGIRRSQIKLLEGGSNTMAVWLGKQYLGQTDRVLVANTAAPAPEEAAVITVTTEDMLGRRDRLVEAHEATKAKKR